MGETDIQLVKHCKWCGAEITFHPTNRESDEVCEECKDIILDVICENKEHSHT